MEIYNEKNIIKFYWDTKLIESYYYKKDKQTSMVVASDIHYHSNVDKDIYRLLVKYVRETKPDFVLMPGDLIETNSFLYNIKEKEFFESIIKDLAEVAPVIIVPGNHEIAKFEIGNYKDRKYVYNMEALKYFESLNCIKNVYFLNNEQTKIKDIMFLGFNPRLATYLKYKDKVTDEMYVEDFIKSGLKMAESDYNILLTHNSLPIISNESAQFDGFDNTDLVVSGHWHDGYLPKKLDKILGNTGAGLFFTPLISPIPGIMCRGVHDFGRGYIFISQGFRKWTADIGLFNAFEKFTANDVEKLIINNPNNIYVNDVNNGLSIKSK